MNIVVQCFGCELSMDPQDEAVEFIERQFQTIGDAEQEIPSWHYAHVGHEFGHELRAYTRTGRQGKLEELFAKRSGAPQS